MSSTSTEQELCAACTSGQVGLVLLLLSSNPFVNVNWASPDRGDTCLHRACRFGHLHIVETLLKHTAVNVNQGNEGLASPLFIACQEGQKEVVALLLADTRVDANKPKDTGATPFFKVCEKGHQEVVALLLADMRIDINEPKNTGRTPLWFAAQEGHLSVVQLILVSGREVETTCKTVATGLKAAAEIARFQGTRARYADESEEIFTRKKLNGPLIAILITSFDLDPVTTRQQLRELPGIRDSFISDLFALVIFLCDDLLTMSAEPTVTDKKATRFFQIVHHLPMELQMVICNRVFGAGKGIVLTKHSEPAFKKLGKLLASSKGH